MIDLYNILYYYSDYFLKYYLFKNILNLLTHESLVDSENDRLNALYSLNQGPETTKELRVSVEVGGSKTRSMRMECFGSETLSALHLPVGSERSLLHLV